MERIEIEYALAKQVSCIASEAVFETNYGMLRLDGGDAKEIARVVSLLLKRKLLALDLEGSACRCCGAVFEAVDEGTVAGFVTHAEDCPSLDDGLDHNGAPSFGFALDGGEVVGDQVEHFIVCEGSVGNEDELDAVDGLLERGLDVGH